MIPPPTQRFETGGLHLAWDSWGIRSETDLVLIHGYSGSMHDFGPHIASLSEHRRVLAMDHPGHGYSDHYDDPLDYRVSRLAAGCVAWLESVADSPVDLLGHSMGGRVVLELVLGWPQLVRSLVLMDTTAWSFAGSDPAAQEPFLSILRSLKRDTDLGTVPFDGDEGAMIIAATSEAWREQRNVVWKRLDPLAGREFGLDLFGDQLTPLGDRLGEIVVPTTVLVGERDGHYTEDAPRMVERIESCQLSMIAGAYHSPQLTHSTEWRAAVEGHLAWR